MIELEQVNCGGGGGELRDRVKEGLQESIVFYVVQ